MYYYIIIFNLYVKYSFSFKLIINNRLMLFPFPLFISCCFDINQFTKRLISSIVRTEWSHLGVLVAIVFREIIRRTDGAIHMLLVRFPLREWQGKQILASLYTYIDHKVWCLFLSTLLCMRISHIVIRMKRSLIQ